MEDWDSRIANSVQSPRLKKRNESFWRELCRIALLVGTLCDFPHCPTRKNQRNFTTRGLQLVSRDVADHLSVIQDTAKIQLHGLKGEVGVIHFSTQVQDVSPRVLHILDG